MIMRQPLQKGDIYSDFWCSGSKEVLAVLPYTGWYTKWFNCVLRVKCDTPRGWIETSYTQENPVFTASVNG